MGDEFATLKPDRSDIVMRYVIEKYARQHPDKACVTTADEENWTWLQARDQMYRAGNQLRHAGIRRGDRVAIMLPNGLDWLRIWWGAACIGAQTVAINPALRGEALAHVLDDASPAVVFAIDDMADRALHCGTVTRVLDPGILHTGDTSPIELGPPIEVWEAAWLCYTSGTTGPAKGVVMTHVQMAHIATPSHLDGGSDDVLLICTPLFHAGGSIYGMSAWLVGATVALRSHFVAGDWLEMLRSSGATRSLLIAAMVPMLMATPENDDDADNPLRSCVMAPLTSDTDVFRKRFDVQTVIVVYGMTELGLPLTHRWDGEIRYPTSAGKVRPGVEVRLVDEHDYPVPDGCPGQFIIRSERPWEICTEYLNQPELTALAWRNGWFHTGDQFVRNEEGFYFFVDRTTDSIRRRGENISSFEVETAASTYPGVVEAACVAVPGEVVNDADVKVFVVAHDRHRFNPVDFIDHLKSRLHYFAIPTFVEVVDAIPKTPTARHQKFLLRAMGNSERTWDRRAAGVIVRRDY